MPNKKRKCKYCKEFVIAESGIKITGGFFCSFDHATSFALQKSEKEKEKQRKARNTAFKKKVQRSDIRVRKEAAKIAFHAFIRYRDKGKPCICCNRPWDETFQAGHFLSSGSNPLIRYDEDNVHGQLLQCNYFSGGDSDDYKGNLIIKIGRKKVDRLLGLKGGVLKVNVDYYIDIEQCFKDKLKLLKVDNHA